MRAILRMDCEVVPTWQRLGSEVRLIRNGRIEEYTARFEEGMEDGWMFPEMKMPWHNEDYKGTDGQYRCPVVGCNPERVFQNGTSLRYVSPLLYV